MTDSGLQGWHVSLFVSAGIGILVLIEWSIVRLFRRDGEPARRDVQGQLVDSRVRAGLLVLLTAVAVVIVAVSMLGPSLADQLAGVTAAVLGVITLGLAYLSYQESLKLSAQLRAAADPDPERQPEKAAE
jgi:hypothetical protein